ASRASEIAVFISPSRDRTHQTRSEAICDRERQAFPNLGGEPELEVIRPKVGYRGVGRQPIIPMQHALDRIPVALEFINATAARATTEVDLAEPLLDRLLDKRPVHEDLGIFLA